MTVSSELFLPTANTAPTGSGKNSASTDKTRIQNTDDNSSENNTNGFKHLLAQETEKTSSRTPPTANKVENSIENNIQKNNIPNVIQEAINEVLADNIPTEASQENLPEQPQKDEHTSGSDSKIIDVNQIPLVNNTQPVVDVPITNSVAAQQGTPKGNNSEKPDNDNPQAKGDRTQQMAGPGEKISEQTKTARNHPDKTPASTKPDNVNPVVSPRQTADAPAVENIMSANTVNTKVSENSQVQEKPHPLEVSAKAEMANALPELEESATNFSQTPKDQGIQTPKDQNITETERSAPQNTVPQTEGTKATVDEKTTTQNTVVQADVNKNPVPLVTSDIEQAPIQQAIAGTETIERQSTTPQQQMAAATAMPAPQIAAENNRSEKDTNPKDSTKGAETAAASAKNRANSSYNIKNTPQNSSEEKNSAAATQNKNSATGPQQLLTPKVPFLTELSQTMTGTEGKTTGLGSLPPPTGLLVAQEVGQNGLQANGLSAAVHGKTHLPPANPQMITKQISMAIMKQADNGHESFKISLKPAHLGQVDIKMDFQADGKMIATVSVDNERTLALLQKDQGSLEKALENAGFDANGNNLNFSLKEQQQNQGKSDFADNDTEDGENNDISFQPDSIISHQQMKMAYSDNMLDINI